jgi:hypothetical protein
MDLNDIKLDINAVEDGIFFPFSDDASVRIAQWSNKAHRKFIRGLRAKHGRKIDAGVLSDAEADKLLAGQWQYIILDWKGFTDDGKPLEYSAKTVVSMAKNPQYRSFFERVEVIARAEENFRVESVKEMGEESRPS